MIFSENTSHTGHSELGYDCVINYKTQDVAKELAAFAPEGISGLHIFAITPTHQDTYLWIYVCIPSHAFTHPLPSDISNNLIRHGV